MAPGPLMRASGSPALRGGTSRIRRMLRWSVQCGAQQASIDHGSSPTKRDSLPRSCGPDSRKCVRRVDVDTVNTSGSWKGRLMDTNVTVDIDAVKAIDTSDLLELVRELEQRLRIASLRIAIEGENVIADVCGSLESLTAFVNEKLH